MERVRRTAAERPLIRATSGTLLLRVVSAGLLFGAAVLLARGLGVRGYGAYSYATAWAGLLATPALLGFDRLLIRSMAAWEATGRWSLMRGLFRRGNQIVAATSALLVALAALGGGLLLDDPLRAPFLLALALVPLIALTGVRRGTLQGLGQIVLGNAPEMLVRPVLLLAGLGALVVATSGFEPIDAMAINLAATAAAFGVGIVLLRRALPPNMTAAAPDYEDRAWIAAATPMMFVGGMLAINFHVAEILLGSLDSAKSVGIYVAAARVTQVMAFLPFAVNAAVGPQFAQLHALGQHGPLQALVNVAVRRLFLLTLPIGLALILLRTPILHLFGNEFESAGTALVIITIGQLFSVTVGSVAVLLMMTGYERHAASGVAVGLLTNLVLGAVLIPPMGVDGAAVATAVSVIVWNGLLALLVYRRLDIDSTVWTAFFRARGR
jgi:O-antigen/teichoic acid export membrane protein